MMISHPKNRVQAIKSKFENLNNDPNPLSKKTHSAVQQLNKQNEYVNNAPENDKENNIANYSNESPCRDIETDSSEDWSPKPNLSYLYNKSDIKRSSNDNKKALTRQSSDPGKKLHRSHAFRCDRSQKIVSPKRHGSCNGRSETSDFTLKMCDKKLSKDRLKRLGNLLEDQMRKENFVPLKNEVIVGEVREVHKCNDSVPDSEVPQHILDQYAKVIKPKKKDNQDTMTDSGVSSETENLEDEKTGRIKKLMSQFEKPEETPMVKSNLEIMDDLCASSETMRLERKNPHLTLTDTLKKALKQPLPAGPPPKKPPRTFLASPIPESPEKHKKDTKKMLEKLEQVLQKREAQSQVKNEYDTVENNVSTAKRPKEMHYLCTEILDISQRTLLPNISANNCFKSLNCAIVTNNSTLSLPYTQLNGECNRTSNFFSCSNDALENSKRLSTFLTENKCSKCQLNETRDGFKCHLSCKCLKSEFFIDNEHIYDEPYNGDDCDITICRKNGRKKSNYGTLNHSKSLEDLRINNFEDQKIYDIPCEISRPATPEFTTSSPKSNFEKLRQNFETGIRDTNTEKPKPEITKSQDTEKAEIRNSFIKPKIGTEKPPMRPKPLFLKKVSKSTENMADEKEITGEKKFATDTKRHGRMQRSDVSSGIKFSLQKKNNNQLDVDRENLNRLMNEIYETVTEACNMDKPSSFPTDNSDGSTSEDSVKLTRSLTEKRKNYVRRVSSRVAYIDTKNIKTRFRHQTSICSYKSEVVDNPYSTFRSWKSFRTSQNNLTNKMADRRESTDSKFNLTDSRGNILSMKPDFDKSNSIDNLSIDEKTGCVDIELPFEPRERGLFNVCLLVGLNYMTGQAYVKSVFPSQVQVPPHIENLIFPETLSSASKGEWSAEAKGAQCYSLVLTDELGERSYGYCRRVLPEGATTCLPLCYCLIGKYRAPGFYYKVLQEIESHHGSSEVEIHSILQQLFETDFPSPGEEITITYTNRNMQITDKCYRNSINLGDILKCKTLPDMRREKVYKCDSRDKSDTLKDQSGNYEDMSTNYEDISGNFEDKGGNFEDKSDSLVDRSKLMQERSESCNDRFPECDIDNNNGPKKVLLSLEGTKTKILKRPIEPRIDEENLSVLLDCLGAGLTIKVFGSLLLERKVLIIGDKLSQVSSCMEALQCILYPFVWQQPLISTIPAEIQRDVLEAPLPILAGLLKTGGDVDTAGILFEEGMLIDLTQQSKVLFYQGDESTILPTSSYKTLKTSLQMEAKQRQEDSKTRNIMISEAFLRFFVDILGDFWRFFSFGELKEGGLGKGDVVFDKEAFLKQAPSKQNQYFLEWFTETAMFNHFIQNMAACHNNRKTSVSSTSMTSVSSEIQLVDTPLPDFYELFEDRVKRCKTEGHKCSDGKTNYKNAVNKRVKILKNKLRELVT